MQYRVEKDSIGEIKVPTTKFWGAQTQRSLENFQIGIEKIPFSLIRALLLVKRAAAKTNAHFKKISPEIANEIIEVVDEILQGGYEEHFPLAVWQTGSGTQSNMNVNEVIAHLANKRQKLSVEIHPNDHVNMSQSSNDVFPTAMHIATMLEVSNHLVPSLTILKDELLKKQQDFKDIIKIGRTHFQDAVPMTLGQEFSGYVTQIENGIARVKNAMQNLKFLAQGGTAVGTGLNAPKGFDIEFSKEVSCLTNIEFIPAANKFEMLATKDTMVDFSGTLNVLAVSLIKIANDIRFLSSGPRCGIGEITLPANEPGSSIMPGKVNPTQCEAITMVCAQVMGNHVTTTIAGSQGHLELNTFKPVIIYNVLQSINILADSCKSFAFKCVSGITANNDHIEALCEKSLMLVTALVPHIGYDKAAEIAKYAYYKNTTLREAGEKLGIINSSDYKKLVKIEDMLVSQ